jgi:hypothetical protein
MGNWSAVEAVSTFVTAVVALYLLGQGQRDRRRIRDDQRSAQARDVLVRVDEIWEPVPGDTARRFKGAEVVVSNHSDRPIAREGLDYIRHHHPEHPDLGPVQVTALDIEEDRLVMGGRSANWERYQEGGFAIVEFRDHDGQRWRRRSDLQDLRKWPSEIRWWQRGIQGLCRAALVLASTAPVRAGSVPKRQAARSQPSALRAQDDTVPVREMATR